MRRHNPSQSASVTGYLSGFGDVDHSFKPRSLVRFLDRVSSFQELQVAKRNSFEVLCIKKGSYVLDVGCGTGEDVRALALMVGRSGRAVGVDSSKIMIGEAKKRSRNLKLRAEFHVADAHRLPFATNSFDGCRADRVFIHLKHPRKALLEMIRVLKPGGRIIVTEPDYDTLLIETGHPHVDRRIEKLIQRSVRHSGVAHRLPNLFKDLGLVEMRCGSATKVLNDYSVADQGFRIKGLLAGACTAGAFTAEQMDEWLDHLEKVGRRRRFWALVTGIGVVGHKPPRITTPK